MIMKLNIDMGKSSECCGPVNPSNEVYYPSFHYEGKEELDIPKQGTMTIRFRKANSSESEDREGNEHYSCTVDVLEILSVDGAESKKSSAKETEDALDSIKAKMEDEED